MIAPGSCLLVIELSRKVPVMATPDTNDTSEILRRIGKELPRMRVLLVDRLDAGERLVHVHGVQQRLVVAGLEFVGDDQKSVRVLV